MSKAPLPAQLTFDLDGPSLPDIPRSKAGRKAGEKSGKRSKPKAQPPKNSATSGAIGGNPAMIEAEVAEPTAAIVTAPISTAPQPAAVSDTAELEPVREGELSPPLRDHERADIRETSNFDLFRAHFRDTRWLIVAAAVSAIVLQASALDTVVADNRWQWMGFDLAISDRGVILFGMLAVTLLLGIGAVANAITTAALFRRCGYYRDVILPRNSLWLRLYWKTQVLLAAVICLYVGYAVFTAVRSVWPHRWTAQYEIDVSSKQEKR